MPTFSAATGIIVAGTATSSGDLAASPHWRWPKVTRISRDRADIRFAGRRPAHGALASNWRARPRRATLSVGRKPAWNDPGESKALDLAESRSLATADSAQPFGRTIVVPSLIVDAGDRAAWRFASFFGAIENDNSRAAYPFNRGHAMA
jgi:hypothetical protein